MDRDRTEINQNIAEAVEKTIMGNADPKSALDEAAAKSNRLLQSIKK